MDNTIFTLVVNPKALPCPQWHTGSPIDHHEARIQAMIDRHSSAKDKIIVPMPSFAEALVSAPDTSKILDEMRKFAAIEPVPFDQRAAIELAEFMRGNRKSPETPWQKVKLDCQIVAVAVAAGAEILYSDDKGQSALCNEIGLKVLHSWDMELPDDYRQKSWLEDTPGV
jgi:hypothetical protein